MTLKERIKELRAEKGMSQKQLAEALNLQRFNVSDWEQGRTEPNVQTLIIIAKFFSVSIDYLVGVEN